MKPIRQWISGRGLGRALGLVLASLAMQGAFADGKVLPLGTPTTSAAKIKHVFVIVLENKNFADTFGTSPQDPYLQKTLLPQGALLSQYYGTGHVSLDNYIAMISGQAATPDTASDCIPGLSGDTLSGQYADVVQTGITPDGQVIAKHGCVYPKTVPTLANQLDAAGLSWKGYMEDMGNDPAREAAACGHPTLGGVDGTNNAEAPSTAVPAGDAYATRHNPFAYFHSLIDSPQCANHVVSLPTYVPDAEPGQPGYQPAKDSKLAVDLSRYDSTPNFVFITPNLCNDGHDGDGTGNDGKGCRNGQVGGLASADEFLKYWVPIIQASPAYQQDGMIVITFDEGGYTVNMGVVDGKPQVTITFAGETCCHQQPGPNMAGARPVSITIPGGTQMRQVLKIEGYGGDRVGALILSPFVKPGSHSSTPYNHYGLLRSLEQIFGVDSYLGYANDPALSRIGDDTAIFR